MWGTRPSRWSTASRCSAPPTASRWKTSSRGPTSYRDRDARGRALRTGALANRPVAFYVQVGNPARNVLWGSPDLTIFNSHFVERQYPWMTGGLVVHPPIEEADYVTAPGDAITLVNLVATKGGRLLFELAERMPERAFIGVQGWGVQEIPDRIPRM